jgi:hypothetical protein
MSPYTRHPKRLTHERFSAPELRSLGSRPPALAAGRFKFTADYRRPKPSGAQRNNDLADLSIALHVAMRRCIFVQAEKDPINPCHKAV